MRCRLYESKQGRVRYVHLSKYTRLGDRVYLHANAKNALHIEEVAIGINKPARADRRAEKIVG